MEGNRKINSLVINGVTFRGQHRKHLENLQKKKVVYLSDFETKHKCNKIRDFNRFVELCKLANIYIYNYGDKIQIRGEIN